MEMTNQSLNLPNLGSPHGVSENELAICLPKPAPLSTRLLRAARERGFRFIWLPGFWKEVFAVIGRIECARQDRVSGSDKMVYQLQIS